jgi:hypothetical protein
MQELIAATRREQVLLTKAGKPFAIVRDASGYDEEDIGYISDPEFWKMIAARRREKGGIPLEKVIARIRREELRLKTRKQKNNSAKQAGIRNGSSRNS